MSDTGNRRETTLHELGLQPDCVLRTVSMSLAISPCPVYALLHSCDVPDAIRYQQNHTDPLRSAPWG